MDQREIDKILNNFVNLIQNCNVESVGERLYKKGQISRQFLNQTLYATKDKPHNRRIFFFGLFKENIFQSLIETLKETEQDNVAQLLKCNNERHPVVFQKACNENSNYNNNNTHFQLPNTIIENASTKILKINVIPATSLLDVGLCYKTRSRQKGVVLVINNYKFHHDYDNSDYRRGAEIDQRNIKELFEQMGLKVYEYSNLTKLEMEQTILNFTTDSTDPNKQCDMCFVIIMSHGKQFNHETMVAGADNVGLSLSWINDCFSNENCKLFLGKPKVLIFQVCRGDRIDYVNRNTEFDSCLEVNVNNNSNQRAVSDRLICHSTVQGFKAHRDTIRGSWYIEIICDIFMNHAHDTHVEQLLKMVDVELSNRVSEKSGVQTSNFLNEGFKNCYINPGVYEENEEMCNY